nr:MAG TPA: hypothetical protein [Microviridae sp.]
MESLCLLLVLDNDWCGVPAPFTIYFKIVPL